MSAATIETTPEATEQGFSASVNVAEMGRALLAVKPCINVNNLTVTLTANDGRLVVMAENYDMSIAYECNADASEASGTLVARHKELTDYLRTRSGADLLNMCGSGGALRLGDSLSIPATPTTGRRSGEVDVEFEPYARMLASALRDGLVQTLPFAAPDGSRPALECVLFNPKPKSGTGSDVPDALRLVTADGFRLGVSLLVDCFLKEAVAAPLLLHRHAAKALAGLIYAERRNGVSASVVSVSVEVDASRTVARFSSGKWVMVARLEQATFPNYEQLVPAIRDAAVHIAVRTTDLLPAAKAAYAVSKRSNGLIRMVANLDGDNIHLSATADGAGSFGAEVPVVVNRATGDATKGAGRFAVQGKYLLDFLAGAGDHVNIHLTTPTAQGRFDGSSGLTAIIMPMFVNW